MTPRTPAKRLRDALEGEGFEVEVLGRRRVRIRHGDASLEIGDLPDLLPEPGVLLDDVARLFRRPPPSLEDDRRRVEASLGPLVAAMHHDARRALDERVLVVVTDRQIAPEDRRALIGRYVVPLPPFAETRGLRAGGAVRERGLRIVIALTIDPALSAPAWRARFDRWVATRLEPLLDPSDAEGVLVLSPASSGRIDAEGDG